MIQFILVLLGALQMHSGVQCLSNGLALTPPMGWLSWERFRCNTDCKNDPENCISEHLFKIQAENMVKNGYLEAGYEYIIIDDCWLSSTRDSLGRLQPDPERFPSGIKALADYIHQLGLKFGIYEDYGNYTCGGYPGILGHLEIDAKTFAEWEVDYVKIDGCYADILQMDLGYPEFGMFLNKTGRPMVYSCSWPAYQVFAQLNPDYASIAKHCNLWRNYGDIQDSWSSVNDIIEFYAKDQGNFSQFAGPGSWNDPDMLIIGNYGLSLDQAKTQMAIWAIFASPLIMSVDLRTIKPDFASILLNKNAIMINQDPLGIQGKRKFNDQKSKISIYVRPIKSKASKETSAAIAVVYGGDEGTPQKVTFTPSSLGLDHHSGYTVTEVFEGKVTGSVLPNQLITVFVNPTGVVFLRLDVNPSPEINHWYNDIESQFEEEVMVSSVNVGKAGCINHDE